MCDVDFLQHLLVSSGGLRKGVLDAGYRCDGSLVSCNDCLFFSCLRLVGITCIADQQFVDVQFCTSTRLQLPSKASTPDYLMLSMRSSGKELRYSKMRSG